MEEKEFCIHLNLTISKRPSGERQKTDFERCPLRASQASGAGERATIAFGANASERRLRA